MKTAYAVSFCVMATAASMPGAVLADSAVPEWAYADMAELVNAGYAPVPATDVRSLSRGDMAMMTARILKRLDDGKAQSEAGPSDLTKTYGLTTRLMASDEVQCSLLEQRVKQLQREYKTAVSKMKSNMTLLARYSAAQIDNERMKQLKVTTDESSQKVESLSGELALAQGRLNRRRIMMQAWQDKRNSLEGQIENAVGMNPNVEEDHLAQMAGRLRAEFAPELSAAGYFDDETAQEQAAVQLPMKPPIDKKLHVDGELRFDYGHNTGSEGIGDRARIRARLYPDYNIDGNWHALGMIESEKTIKGQEYDNSDGSLRLDRYYLEGMSGIVKLDVGAFGSTMAEGNIYDSKFKGIRATVGKPVRYSVETGSVTEASHAFDATVSYDTSSYGVDAGYYHFSPINGASRNIYMANFRKPLGWLDFSAMYLRGSDSQLGSGNGYVLTLSHGREDSWNPGAYRIYGKYYYQPFSTYVEHTMNGMADFMTGGFRGYGFGYTYTLKKDWVLGLEYDSLWDLATHERNNTIWGSLSYYFKNYEE